MSCKAPLAFNFLISVRNRNVFSFCIFKLSKLLLAFNRRKYAEAKQNCANIARQACRGICEYIPKDEYNPFCSNHTDPPATSELFGNNSTVSR